MEYRTGEPKKSNWSMLERRTRSTVRTAFVHYHLGPQFLPAHSSRHTQATDSSDTRHGSPLHEPCTPWIGSADSHTIAACSQPSSLGGPQCSAAKSRRHAPHQATTRMHMPATVLRCCSYRTGTVVNGRTANMESWIHTVQVTTLLCRSPFRDLYAVYSIYGLKRHTHCLGSGQVINAGPVFRVSELAALYIFRASVSEPHTCGFNAAFSLYNYRYNYVQLYVVCIVDHRSSDHPSSLRLRSVFRYFI